MGRDGASACFLLLPKPDMQCGLRLEAQGLAGTVKKDLPASKQRQRKRLHAFSVALREHLAHLVLKGERRLLWLPVLEAGSSRSCCSSV